MKLLACAFVALATAAASASQALSQTFQATRAIEEVKCQRYLFSNKCVTVETDRLHWTFTQAKLGFYVFGRTWATASHCTHADATETMCLRSISISTDPEWNRVLWGQPGTFLRLLGTGGRPADGPYHFLGPLGVDITRREGEWHVGFIADSRNNRVVVIAFGSSCMCVRWLGTLDGSESGTPLREPYDVAWDPADTWTFGDDRVFIADTYNDRVVVYKVALDLVAWTMTKTYLNSFGTSGSGAAQFSHPKGITVRSRTGTSPFGPPPLWADVYISDTDNHRVSVWLYDASNSSTPGDASAAAQSAPIAGSEFVGITQDYYGDVIVADRARDVLVKFAKFTGSPFTALKTYGGTASWSTGNFNHPTDAAVIPHYWQDAAGNLIQERLPFIQSVEQWTATTGGQLHHLGVDADGLAVVAGQCDASFTFLLTAYGDYNLKVKNAAGAVVASWSRAGVSSGPKNEFWNAQGQSPGQYSFVVEHRSAYGDETSWRMSTGPSFNLNCFTVTASVPADITQGGTYAIYGASSHPADSWAWQENYAFYTNAQNSSFYVPNDPGTYTIDWQLSARRTSDGVGSTDYKSTHVSIAPDPPPCPNPPCMDQSAPIPGDTRERRRVTPPQAPLVRRNHHVGSGAWIGWRTGTGGAVEQLYSFTGRHQSQSPLWPNVLAGDDETTLNAKGGISGNRVVFTRQAISGGEAYRARFLTSPHAASFVGLALDPELGTRPSDDSLGFDQTTGLIWVVDPDSGAIGYLVTDLPMGARASLRQFSNRNDAWHPDPVGDSAAYLEISASSHALSGKPGDVRMLIAIGPMPSGSDKTDVGFILLSAPSLVALRERVATVPRSVLPLFHDTSPPTIATATIPRFRLTQAPPDPMAPDGVRAVSLALVPGLSGVTDSATMSAVRLEWRDAVRHLGITALAFAVPDGSQAPIKIRLFDPAGRLVRTLVDDVYATGAYRVQWDLKDHRGRGAAPGVYIAIMEAPGFRAMTRLVVVP